MTSLRLVACGLYTRQQEVFFECDPIWADGWHESVANAYDSMPEQPVSPDYPRLWPSDEEAAEMAQELEDAMDDEKWIRKGC